MKNFDLETSEELSLEEIRNKLIEADDLYYNDSSPTLSDEEYDNLKALLKSSAPNDKYLFKTGIEVKTSEWKKATHKIPMGSLNKINTVEEFQSWIKKVGSPKDLILSTKLDGISIDLEYESGKLIKAITRGDGFQGENIFSNVIQMKNCKPALNSFTGSLRGEIVIHKEDFIALNIESEKFGDRVYKNLRNSASGVSKNFSGKYAKFCTILYYDITGDFKKETEKFEKIHSLGLECAWNKRLNPEELLEEYKSWETQDRENYFYELDGLCIYINDIEKSLALGTTYDNPAGKVAFKFGNICKPSEIIGVAWQLGKNRRITPVANFVPTPLGGVTIENASLHNIDIFLNHDLGMNDKVMISRKNDVIPFLEHVIKSGGKKFEYPKFCPTCKTPTEIQGKFLMCPNDNCESLFLGNLIKWIDKLEIMDISFSFIEKLFQAGLIKTPSDLYTLKKEDFAGLEGLGEKSAKKFLDQLNNKKELDLPVFIGALNMGNFSTSICEKISSAGYNTLEKIQSLDSSTLCKIQGIKEKIAEKIIFGLKAKKEIIESLLKVGIKIKTPQETIGVEMKSAKLNGISVVFTGGINRENPETGKSYTRNDLQKMVSENGGVNHSSITKNTSFLCQADPSSQSSKTKKAISYGVKILSEESFFKMLGL